MAAMKASDTGWPSCGFHILHGDFFRLEAFKKFKRARLVYFGEWDFVLFHGSNILYRKSFVK